jgi:site-specific recombinase XerD
VFGIPADQLRGRLAHQHHLAMEPQEAAELFQARALAYAPSTWATHASAFREFRKFCELREIGLLNCTPPSLNVFLLTLAQNGKSINSVDSILASISFCYRFYLLRDITRDAMLAATKKFVGKVCPKVTNLKAPFGSYEVRKMWNALESKYDNICDLPFAELRTFVLAVVQYSSLCRFSDLAVVKLEDVVFQLDYFKICIQYSKTDQKGSGQNAFVLKSVDSVRDAHMLMCIYLQRLDTFNVQNLYLFPPLQ